MCAEKMHLQLKPKDDDSFFVNTQIIAQWLRKVFLTKIIHEQYSLNISVSIDTHFQIQEDTVWIISCVIG